MTSIGMRNSSEYLGDPLPGTHKITKKDIHNAEIMDRKLMKMGWTIDKRYKK